MKILRRYVLSQHFWPFVFALSALTSFELLRQIARKLQDLLGKGLPWTVIVEFFLLTIPFLIAITLSMAVLVAVLYTMSRLAADYEITAMRAGGVSIGQIVRPLLGAAAVVAAASFLFSDQILPRTNHRLRTLMVDIYRTKPTFSLKEHVINEVQKGRTALWAAQIDQATYRMGDVTLYSLEENNRKRIVYADSGYLEFAQNQEDLQLVLYDGSIHEFDRDDPRMFQKTDFGRQVILVRGVGSEFVRRDEDSYRSDREMSVCQLEREMRNASHDAAVSEYRANLAELNGLRELVYLPPVAGDSGPPMPGKSVYCRAIDWIGGLLQVEELEAQERGRPVHRPPPQRDSAAAVPFTTQFNEPARRAFATGVMPRQRSTEVRVLRDKVRSASARVDRFKVEYHKKYSIPAACFVLVLVGVPLALRFPGGGMGLVLGGGMVVFSVYYIGLIGGESLADRGIVPPFLAMWASNILFSLVGGVGLLWVARAGAQSRRGARSAARAQLAQGGDAAR
jgi:lipopolysaccharide export system permease protein